MYFGSFLTPRVLSSLLLDNAYLLVLAVGMTFVILTARHRPLGRRRDGLHGDHGCPDAERGGARLVVIPVMLLGGALIGLIIGVLVQYFDVQPFIASLAGMFLARGLAFLVSLSSIKIEDPTILWLQTKLFLHRGVVPRADRDHRARGRGRRCAGAAFTRFGRTIYAIGGNEQSARLMGLPVVRTKLLAYVISGICAGFAGVVFSAYQGPDTRSTASVPSWTRSPPLSSAARC